jgi:hypothetical protein
MWFFFLASISMLQIAPHGTRDRPKRKENLLVQVVCADDTSRVILAAAAAAAVLFVVT